MLLSDFIWSNLRGKYIKADIEKVSNKMFRHESLNDNFDKEKYDTKSQKPNFGVS